MAYAARLFLLLVAAMAAALAGRSGVPRLLPSG
jgi:hypothetical protein